MAAAAVILALSLAASPGGAVAQFSATVRQIEVYASVTDEQGRPVRGLRQEDFTVVEDGVRQTVDTFVAGDLPAAVALAIDRSVSMRGEPLSVARSAGRVFVSALHPDDRVMVLGVGSQVDVLSPFPAGRAGAVAAIERLDPWGTTSLHDAIVRAIGLLDEETGRRAIVLLSDGTDRYSTASAADVLTRARRSDVMIYPVALGPRRSPLFAELATTTGGRSFHLREMKALEPTLRGIAEDLRAQYLLGYQPGRAWPTGEPEWRSIEVKVNDPAYRVRARSGYTTR